MNIENCTCVFKILPGTQRFTSENFLAIARNGINTEYNPKRFHAIIMRIRHANYKTTAALIFQSSKVVLTGVPRPEFALRMAWKVTRSIQKSYSAAKCKEVWAISVRCLKVTNIVGSFRCNNKLSIEQIYRHLKIQNKLKKMNKQIFYEPTIFPALRFKMMEEGYKAVSILIYISGRVIMTGLTSEKQLNNLFYNFLIPLINKFPRL
uniref:Uncharacterized protein n=2 Tax=Meloidogyne TaxID=189290 RepID=A0A6V7XEK8_MELEN|nr:unnamed protein product [Meloidogyne enterolobii]CAD2197780.1 unnamed protein product [Meloidogyne enterolobii]CAD2200983.1 unnamed protein product [Meloidogyne enterolobii]CAD2201835.1 unnamed protein product [Meloidogyne enterolobii]